MHAGVTKYPTDEWTAQQLREATPWGKGPKYLIRDRDGKYVRRSFKFLTNPEYIYCIHQLHIQGLIGSHMDLFDKYSHSQGEMLH